MRSFFKTEFTNLYVFLQETGNETTIISLAALFLTLGRYHPIWNDWFSSIFYYALLPVLVIVLWLWGNPLKFGLGLGNVRIWTVYVAITCLVAIPILYVASRLPAFQAYYRTEKFSLISHFLIYLGTLFGSEFLFRGFMLFGLKERFREGSIFIQMIPFVLVHFSKPEIETLSTIVTGIYFGYVCYRSNSFWPAFIIHMFINVFFVAAVNLL